MLFRYRKAVESRVGTLKAESYRRKYRKVDTSFQTIRHWWISNISISQKPMGIILYYHFLWKSWKIYKSLVEGSWFWWKKKEREKKPTWRCSPTTMSSLYKKYAAKRRDECGNNILAFLYYLCEKHHFFLSSFTIFTHIELEL